MEPQEEMKQPGVTFLVAPGLRIVLLFLTWIVGSMAVVFLGFVLQRVITGNAVALMRISTVFQDILMFIVPAIATAVIVTRQPARLLALDRLPSMRQTVLGVLLLVVSTPLMSWVIRLNEGMHLPESMASLEQALRTMEQNAGDAVAMLLNAPTPGAIVMNILIIGILAGFSEELFFRGALQRILMSGKLPPHAAIWLGAVVFSALHLQFFGFIPRMLLGGAFGYLLWWSGSVWLPMLIHALNNTMFVILYHATGSGEPQVTGADSWVAVAISAVLTVLTLIAFSKTSRAR